MNMRTWPALLVVAVMVGGCSGVGLIASSDPRVKVGQAEEMMRQGRIARAKQLLNEAEEIAQKDGDERSWAEVYRGYGLFYRDGGSDDIVIARSGSALSSSSTGYEKAQENFARAATLFEKLKVYDRLSNVHFLMAQVYYRLDDKARACASLDDSLAANRQAMAANPGQKVELMSGIASFEQGIARAKSEVGCPAS